MAAIQPGPTTSSPVTDFRRYDPSRLMDGDRMLQRAAVLIGVRKTGGLPQLSAVASGLDKVRAWAESQPGMAGADGTPRVTVLSDATGTAVTAKDVSQAIKKWIE